MQAGRPGPLIYGPPSEDEMSGGFGDQHGVEREERQVLRADFSGFSKGRLHGVPTPFWVKGWPCVFVFCFWLMF